MDSYVGAFDPALESDDADLADAILARSVATVEGTMPEHCLGSLVLLALEWEIIPGDPPILRVKRTDGTTTHFDKTLGTSASAEAITEMQ